MKEFVEFIVKRLVDYPEKVVVTEVEGERTLVFELRVEKSDMGKVIGKKGNTAYAELQAKREELNFIAKELKDGLMESDLAGTNNSKEARNNG